MNTLAGLLKRTDNVNMMQYQGSFRQRLVLQKTIYILQDGFNIPLGYDFSWYVHGPYSPALARDAYLLVDRYEDLPRISFVDEQVESRFLRFLSFIEPHKTDSRWLETAACLLYQRRMGESYDDACQILVKKNPFISLDLCSRVYSRIVEWHLMNS